MDHDGKPRDVAHYEVTATGPDVTITGEAAVVELIENAARSTL